MLAVRGEITAKTLNTFKIMRVPLEEVSRKFSMEHPVQVNLWWSDDKYTYDYPGNQYTQTSLLDKSAGFSGFQGIVYRRSGHYEEKRHHPLVKKCNMDRGCQASHSIIDVPGIKIKYPVNVKEKY